MSGAILSTLKVPKPRFLYAIIFCFLLPPVNSKPFNSIVCRNFLANHPSNTTYLSPGSSEKYVQLSYDSCLVACGKDTRRFEDIIPRLNTWLLPVLFLLASAQYPSAAENDRPFEKVRRKAVVCFEALAHILGDPVNYTYTLLSQVENWKACHNLASNLPRSLEDENIPDVAQIQNVAIILAAVERVFDHLENHEKARQYFEIILDTLKKRPGDMATAIKDEAKIARDFAIVRTRHLAPAIFAIAFYAWQVVGAFVPVIGASPSPSGGRVATALTLSWIICIVLFGNTVGEVASRTAYENTIKNYIEERLPTNVQQGTSTSQADTVDIGQLVQACLGTTYYTGYCHSLARNAPESAENELPLNARLQHEIMHRRHSRHLLRALAHMPVFVAVVCALAVTSLPPTYFSVRHGFFFGVGIMYHIISPTLTLILLHRWRSLRAVRWKNAVIALCMIGLFVANSCGLFFNNCRGWTTIFPRNHGVVLFSEWNYYRNGHLVFPTITSICVGTQVLLCVALSRLSSEGLGIMRWRTHLVEFS